MTNWEDTVAPAANVMNDACDGLHSTLDRLAYTQQLAHAAAVQVADHVQNSRDEGYSWEAIGNALGMSRQAAWERFGKG